MQPPVNLPLGVFSRAEQRVFQSIFKVAEGGREMCRYPRNDKDAFNKPCFVEGKKI